MTDKPTPLQQVKDALDLMIFVDDHGSRLNIKSWATVQQGAESLRALLADQNHIATALEEADSWKQTVRNIFDKVLLSKNGMFAGNPLASEILEIIEQRHHAYFCEGEPMEADDGK